MAWLKKYVIIFVVCALLISNCIFILYNVCLDNNDCQDNNDCPHNFIQYMEFLGSDKVKVRVKFEGCACGLDYPQYIIDSVVYTDSGWDAAYLNKNVYLQTTSIKHKSLLQMTQASGCYTWIIKGKIQKNGYGMHQLIIEKVERFIDKNCLED